MITLNIRGLFNKNNQLVDHTSVMVSVGEHFFSVFQVVGIMTYFIRLYNRKLNAIL